MSNPGDVYEIKTKNGFVYFRHINSWPKFADVIQVYDGFFEKPSSNIQELRTIPKNIIAMFNTDDALRHKEVRYVGNIPLADIENEFPEFIDDSLAVLGGPWMLFNGKESVKIGKTLTEKQRKLPRKGVFNAAGLRLKILGQWQEAKEIR